MGLSQWDEISLTLVKSLLTRSRIDAISLGAQTRLRYIGLMALLDYLAERRVQIEAQIKELRGELAEIKIAEAAISGAGPSRGAVVRPQGGAIVREGSIKDWVLKALSAAPEEGLDTDDVISSTIELGGPEVRRSSMTPQLSRLKAAGLIEQSGRFWRLFSSAPQNDETPGVQPPDVPEDGVLPDLI